MKRSPSAQEESKATCVKNVRSASEPGWRFPGVILLWDHLVFPCECTEREKLLEYVVVSV